MKTFERAQLDDLTGFEPVGSMPRYFLGHPAILARAIPPAQARGEPTLSPGQVPERLIGRERGGLLIHSWF